MAAAFSRVSAMSDTPENGGSSGFGAILDEMFEGRPWCPRADPDSGPEDRLGTLAKSVDQEPRKTGIKTTTQTEDEYRRKRRQRYALQRVAAKLIPEERVSKCRWTVQRMDEPVELMLVGSRSFYSGLQTCGSVWHCPVCSQRISETRRDEMNRLLIWARENGYTPVMLTLTASHSRDDELADQLARMKKAKKRLRQRREWRRLKDRIIGTVTATEVTHGRNGWHSHFHEILIVDLDSAEIVVAQEKLTEAYVSKETWYGLSKTGRKDVKQRVVKARKALREHRDVVETEILDDFQSLVQPWLACLRGYGLDGLAERAVHLAGASFTGEYVTKWGAGEEVTLGSKKNSRKGRTPMELLTDHGVHHDSRAGEYWIEYAEAFKGKRQLVWSRGLKDLAGIDDVDDADAAEDGEEEPEEEIVMAMIDAGTWQGAEYEVGCRYRRVTVMETAERTRDPGQVHRVIYDLSSDHDDPGPVDPGDVVDKSDESPESPRQEPPEDDQKTPEGPPRSGEDPESSCEQGHFSSLEASLADPFPPPMPGGP